MAQNSKIVTDDRVARFVGARVGMIIYPPFVCMGIERDGEIIAGAVFNCFTGPDIEVTVAGHGWSRAFFKAIGVYVFDQLKCVRIQVTTENEATARLAERMGCQREGVLRDKFGTDRDGIVLGVLKREYLFYESSQSTRSRSNRPSPRRDEPRHCDHADAAQQRHACQPVGNSFNGPNRPE